MGRGVLGRGGRGAHEEAGLAAGLGGLDDGVRLAGVVEGLAHLLGGDIAGAVEGHRRAADELDAEVQAAEAHDGQARHHGHGGHGEEHLAVAEEVDVVLDEAARGSCARR